MATLHFSSTLEQHAVPAQCTAGAPRRLICHSPTAAGGHACVLLLRTLGLACTSVAAHQCSAAFAAALTNGARRRKTRALAQLHTARLDQGAKAAVAAQAAVAADDADVVLRGIDECGNGCKACRQSV